MRWDKEVESKLKEYPKKKRALENLEYRLATIDQILCTRYDDYRRKAENEYLDRLVEKRELENNYLDVSNEIEWIEKGLVALTNEEREVIDKMYFSEPQLSREKICEVLGYEKSNLYNIRNRAIYKITLTLYGKM